MANILSDLYPSLASVAAITTSLQVPIALQTINECQRLREEIKKAPDNTQKKNNALRSRKGVVIKLSSLNLPATIVNAVVIATWGYLVTYHARDHFWLYWWPWFAVLIAAVFLLGVVLFAV